MRIARSDKHKLVIVDRPYLVPGIATLLAVVLLAELVKASVQGNPREILGSVLGLLVAVSGAYATGKRSVFTFDLDGRILRWSRRELFRTKGGAIPFDGIAAVAVESASAGDTGRSVNYRVVLKTSDGVLALSEGYWGGAEEKYAAIRTAIASALNLGEPVQGAKQAKQSDNALRSSSAANHKTS